jgi:predicted ATPase
MNNFKVDELSIYANSQNLHLIGIAETWLNESIDNSEINIDGYTLYRKDRADVKAGRGGGVVLYVHNSLNSCFCSELNVFQTVSMV